MNIFTDSQYFCGQIYRCVWIFKFTNKMYIQTLIRIFPLKNCGDGSSLIVSSRGSMYNLSES